MASATNVVELPRRVVLGGSTLPAACGIDPYCSPIRLWLELTGALTRHETEAMRLGTRLQPVIFDVLRDDGYTAHEVAPDFEERDRERSWLVGHPDGFGVDGDGDYVVEAKAMGYGTDACPVQHEAQVQTYLHLTGLDHGIVAQLAGLRLQVFEVERKQVAIDAMLELGEAFVGYVERREIPPPLGHDDDRASLTLAYPAQTPGRTVRETRQVRDARRELRSQLEAAKARDCRIEHLRATITAHMADAETLTSLADDTPVATWKASTTRRLDTDRLKRERPDVYAEYARATSTRRLVVT